MRRTIHSWGAISALAIIFAMAFSPCPVSAQERRVANYSTGKIGTSGFEQLAFWVSDGKREEISYSYGKDFKEIKLAYIETAGGGFKVQFQNGHTLTIMPKGLLLRVTSDDGKYSKTFRWQYEGPIDGRGTFCDPCAEDEREAMKLVRENFLK